MLSFSIEDVVALQRQLDRFIENGENQWTSVKNYWDQLQDSWKDKQYEHFEPCFSQLTEQYQKSRHECKEFSSFLQQQINEVRDIPIISNQIDQAKENGNTYSPLQHPPITIQQSDSLPSTEQVVLTSQLMNNNPEDETTQSLNLIGSLYDSLVYAYTSTNKSLSNNHITAKVNDCLNQFSEHLGSDKFVQGVNSIKKQINDLIVGLLISSSTMTCIISTQVFETLKSPMLQADTILSIPGNLYEVIEKAGQYADSTSKSIDAASELNIKNDNLGRIHSASQDISYFSNQIQDIIKNGQEKLVSDYDSLEKWSDEEERKRKQRMKQMDIGEEIRQMQSITPSLVL